MNVNEMIQISEVAAKVIVAHTKLSEVMNVWKAEYDEGMQDLSDLETVFDLLSESKTTLENVLCGSREPTQKPKMHRLMWKDEQI